MHMLKLFPIVALLGFAHAQSDDRSACIAREAQASLDSAPANADIAICYHGHNSAYTNDGNTVKDADVFGGLRWADCNGIGIDCFWMSGGGKLGENIFQYWGDDGPDNLAFVKRNDNCEYHPDDKIIYCHN